MQLDRPLAAITPTLDGDVLSVLASADSQFTTGQVHRVLERFSEHGIRKVLTRLAEQGIVHAEQVGRTVAYSLNRHHLAAGPIIELGRSRSELIDRLSDLIDGWEVQPLFAAMFGSAVRGSMRADSDIDIIVIHRDDDSDLLWDAQLLDITLAVPRWTGNRAEVMSITESDVFARGRDKLLGDVRVFGLTIGGDRTWLDRTLRAPRGQ
ncbi:nucleotidyltransferase domain-containing protein [Jatrophihabitans endophyticus]|uniref:nucleotidyltransferase domain-containing protein n=1 Tax=Jatrophihabitans endophyticus TaxID=1206085 RepID=UPI0019F28951|nr:nucleotidyltransferase domain-containing protein [Jatrophihabitans endophyticus]MBE7188266.1 nucleotidyltransferase domain-containing protein [Jatrophihabitans endophyticus]